MQQPIDSQRVEVARIDLLLLLENAGSKTNRGKREGLEPSRRMLLLIGSQGLNGCRGADQAQSCGRGRSLEEVAARMVNHRVTPAQSYLQPASKQRFLLKNGRT